ncbi:MAG: AMP-binding protein [Pararhodobacter sp.]|nr:AMP-binding protein [Pararhodobacter sp.]
MTQDPGIEEMRRLASRLVNEPLPASIGDFVRERARSLGERTAAIWFEKGIEVSFAQLDRRSDAVAAGLLACGIRKGAHVAVMLPNIPEFLFAWFAIAKLGAVMVPVNSGYTGAELDYLLNQSDTQALIIDATFLPALRAMQRRPEVLDQARVFVHGTPDAGQRAFADLLATDGPFDPPWPVVATDLASLQYTSGTTGFPKGCMLVQDYWILLSHAAALGSAELQIERTLLWAPFFYMDPQWQFLMSMKLGATAHIAERLSLSRFFDWVRTHRIHYTYFPEAVLKALPEGPEDAEIELKYINAFGWSPEAIAEAERRFGVIARDSFGMTEIGAGMMMPHAATHKLQSRSCGVPAPFREIRVVDAEGHPCPPGEPGELQLRGRSILLGYYKNPAANEAAFDGGWFRSGDLFVQDEDGYLRIVGRIKDMIRRSGENISAREVEAVANAHPDIEESAAIPVPDPLRKEEVKIYLKLRQGIASEAFDMGAFLDHCASHLAAFKLPRYVAFIDSFPRTASHKIAKPALISATDDLRKGSFDRVESTWR